MWLQDPVYNTQPGTIDVWDIIPQFLAEHFTLLERYIDPEERTISTRYYKQEDQKAFIARRAILRVLLSKYLSVSPFEIKFGPWKNKKPGIIQPRINPIYFNISHSSDRLLLAIGQSEVGIDIEKNDQQFDFGEVVSHSFSSDECDHIHTHEQPGKLFYRLWTRKEALIKATAKGIDEDLKLIPCLDGTHYIPGPILDSSSDWEIYSFTTSGDEASIACLKGNTVQFLRLERMP